MWKDIVIKGSLIYPDEDVVRCISKYFGLENKGKKAIDLGCGVGRHLAVMHRYGFDSYGLDLYEEVFEEAKTLFPELKENCTFLKGDYNLLNTSDIKFDLAVSWGSIFLNNYNGVMENLRLFYNNLNSGGYLLADYRTKENFFYASGEKISENTYILNSKAGVRENMTYSFFDREELIKMYEEIGFVIDSIEDKLHTRQNGEEKHTWHIVTAHKK